MQVVVISAILIALLGFIIYKINNKFGTKELIILASVIVVSILAFIMILRNEKNKVPELFKQKYEATRNIKISKFSYKRLNSITVTSKRDFIYNFDYIIIKDNEEYLCSVKNVKVKKIEDEYVFENFNDLKEKCVKN